MRISRSICWISQDGNLEWGMREMGGDMGGHRDSFINPPILFQCVP